MATRRRGGQPGNKNASKFDEDKAVKIANDYYASMISQNRYPSDEMLAFNLGVTMETANDWFNDPEKIRFREAVSRGRAQAVQLLFDNSLAESMDGRFAALLLKNRHGFVDKVEQKVEADVGVKIVFEDEK